MGLKQPVIYVVDDETDIRDTICDLLGLADYAARGFEDGFAALAAMKASPPQLLITDLQMPCMSGFELLERVHSDGRLAATPILVVSGQAQSAPTRVCRMSKPFDGAALLACVRAILTGKMSCSEPSRAAIA